MGQVELSDQVEVMSWLGSVTGYLDLERVAVTGWSYGGYLSLMALAQYPKLFKVRCPDYSSPPAKCGHTTALMSAFLICSRSR